MAPYGQRLYKGTVKENMKMDEQWLQTLLGIFEHLTRIKYMQQGLWTVRLTLPIHLLYTL